MIHFECLKNIADSFELKALEAEERITREPPTKMYASKREAATWRAAAQIARFPTQGKHHGIKEQDEQDAKSTAERDRRGK